MTPSFDRFIAVDWSGAAGRSYDGIAVAECPRGAIAPALVAPPGRRWRRTDFVEWLVGRTGGPDRLLIGIDCNFALPAAAGQAILGRAYKAAELWTYIDKVCANDDDLYGGGFAALSVYAPLFWCSGRRPEGFVERLRATEQACRAAGLGAPESALKLLGARQVGKGSLAGMRALARLKLRLGNALAVWPFDTAETARIVCVELFPRLIMRIVGHGSSKVRTLDELDRCLDALGGGPYRDRASRLSDHETDALVGAAGLRALALEARHWTPPGLDDVARSVEGWIFGVASTCPIPNGVPL